MRLLFVLVVLNSLILSCSTSKKENDALIPEEQFIELVAHFQLLQSALYVDTDTLKMITLRDSILDQYQISLDEFYRSDSIYHTDIEQYQELLNKAMDILNEEKTRLWDN